MNKIFTLLAVVLLPMFQLSAQDIHFSHIHASPTTINPATTGVFAGYARFIVNYRNQWRSVTADYKTFMASADVNLPGLNRNSVIGLGVQTYNDVAGDLNFTINNSGLSLSLLQMLNRKRNHIIAGGFQLSRVRNYFDRTRIVAFDEEPGMLQDNFGDISYFDLSAGLLWYKGIKDKDFLYLGTALYHVGTPEVSFMPESHSDRLYSRTVIHGGANFSLDAHYTLIPNFIFFDQGPHREITIGGFVRYEAGDKLPDAFASIMFGSWLRWYSETDGTKGSDAFIASIRLDYKGIICTFTYDMNVSTLKRVSFGRGGPEFSMIYILGGQAGKKKKKDKKGKKKRKPMHCPHF